MKNTTRSRGSRYDQIREELKNAVSAEFSEWNVTQASGAERFGVARSYLCDVLNSDNRNLSVGALLAMLLRAGVDVSVTISKAPSVGEGLLNGQQRSINVALDESTL